MFISGDQESPVGFSIYPISDAVYNDGQTVNFNAVISNLGGHFNTKTSSFVCPFDGVYFFSLNYLSLFNEGQEDDSQLCIMQDTKIIACVRSSNNGINHASGFVIVSCSLGESIWVQSVGTSDIAGDENKDTIFSGYLLYRY